MESSNSDGRLAPLHHLGALAPGIIGLAFARVATLAVFPTGALQEEGASINDGTSIFRALFFTALALGLLAYEQKSSTQKLNRTTNDSVGQAIVALQLGCFGLMSFLHAAGETDAFLHGIGSTLSSIVGTAAIFYWLVCARGLPSSSAAIYVIGARILSEAIWLVLFFAPRSMDFVLCMAAAIIQLLCIRQAARGADDPLKKETRVNGDSARSHSGAVHDAPEHSNDEDRGYFFGMDSELFDRKFLLYCILSCLFLSFAIGIIRSYPGSAESGLSAATAVLSATFSAALCVGFLMALPRTNGAGLVGAAWGAMMILGCLTILSFSFMPADLAYGNMFATVLNSIMGTFKWYLTVALLSLGNRNPYLYAIVVYLVFLLPRDLAQFLLIVYLPPSLLSASTLAALTALLLVGASQIIIVRTLLLLGKPREKFEPPSPLLESVFETDAPQSIADRHAEAVRQSAQEIGRRFDLTGREVEVLALFALGHTQKRVAEELFISPSTAHAHIRHIYDKTDLHSRQEIIDCIKRL